jgi:hypothetical protein
MMFTLMMTACSDTRHRRGLPLTGYKKSKNHAAPQRRIPAISSPTIFLHGNYETILVAKPEKKYC